MSQKIAKLVLAGILLFSASAPAFAQTRIRPEPPGRRHRWLPSKKVLIAGAVLGAAMILDSEATTRWGRRCPSCVESNPLTKGILGKRPGRPRLYFTGGAVLLGQLWLGSRLERSTWKPARTFWWAPIAAETAEHAIAARRQFGYLAGCPSGTLCR